LKETQIDSVNNRIPNETEEQNHRDNDAKNRHKNVISCEYQERRALTLLSGNRHVFSRP
jgi:hypothetical protein